MPDPAQETVPTVGELADRLAHGDESALRVVYQRWAPLVFTVALTSLGSRADAEDVTQQVFIAAWRSRQTLRASDTALPAWLMGICRYKIIDALRARSRTAGPTEDAADGSVADRVDELTDRMLVHDALRQLGEPRASVLRAVFLYDQTHQEAADALGMPLGTVKSHVRRGLAMLKAMFEEVDDAPTI